MCLCVVVTRCLEMQLSKPEMSRADIDGANVSSLIDRASLLLVMLLLLLLLVGEDTNRLGELRII